MSATPIAEPRLAPFAYTGRKLGACVLGFVLAILAVVTLEPFAFAVPRHVALTWWDGWFDAIANVVLFLPAGFLFALTRSATERGTATAATVRRTLVVTGLLACAVSGSVECAQIFEPTRYPSPTDVATNVLGALLGAWTFTRVARRLEADTPLVGRLALELPLVGLLYLLLPLLTLVATTVRGGSGSREWALLALALFGGTILGHVQRRHLRPARALTAVQAALVGAMWFALGALPAVATAPLAFAAGVAIAAVATWAHGRDDGTVIAIDRRVELQALGRAAPWLLAYLALLPLTDPALPPAVLARVDVLRRVETIAAFAVTGYVLAEAWGRFELRYRFVAWRVAVVAGLGAIVAEALRRAAVPSPAAAPALVAQTVAAAYGGWIYHLQRAHVRALATAGRTPAERRPAPEASPPAGTTGRVYPFPTPPLTARPSATTPAPAARSGRASRRPR